VDGVLIAPLTLRFPKCRRYIVAILVFKFLRFHGNQAKKGVVKLQIWKKRALTVLKIVYNSQEFWCEKTLILRAYKHFRRYTIVRKRCHFNEDNMKAFQKLTQKTFVKACKCESEICMLSFIVHVKVQETVKVDFRLLYFNFLSQL
jgi:hypothetical protein